MKWSTFYKMGDFFLKLLLHLHVCGLNIIIPIFLGEISKVSNFVKQSSSTSLKHELINYSKQQSHESLNHEISTMMQTENSINGPFENINLNTCSLSSSLVIENSVLENVLAVKNNINGQKSGLQLPILNKQDLITKSETEINYEIEMIKNDSNHDNVENKKVDITDNIGDECMIIEPDGYNSDIFSDDDDSNNESINLISKELQKNSNTTLPTILNLLNRNNDNAFEVSKY